MQFDIDLYPFPPIENTNEDGIIAIGGDLSPGRLLSAYKKGIFPWFSDEDPILWWCPDPRFVLFPHKLKIAKSMRPLFNKKAFDVTINQCFEKVIAHCADAKRKEQDGTWITQDMIKAYTTLHQLGYAHSVEVWQNKKLVGGLYGIVLGKVFSGESMFSLVSNASKYGFIHFVGYLKSKNCQLIDCQVYTQHLESLGAEEIPREEFLKLLQLANDF